MAKGGDVTEITYNHPTEGDGVIYPKAAEDSEFDPGGFRESDDENNVDGGGNMIIVLNRGRWHCAVTAAWETGANDNLIKMKNIVKTGVPADWTITLATGEVYKGKGLPVGPLVGNGNAGTFPLKLAGGGDMKPLV